ncbi:MAG TPA: hypothetical protein VIJ14_05470, partial [Rhabdochlamydiaceae bacterium]
MKDNLETKLEFITNALIEAKKCLEQFVWIDVDKQLPKIDETVLTWDGFYIGLELFADEVKDGKWTTYGVFYERGEEVIKW